MAACAVQVLVEVQGAAAEVQGAAAEVQGAAAEVQVVAEVQEAEAVEVQEAEVAPETAGPAAVLLWPDVSSLSDCCFSVLKRY